MEGLSVDPAARRGSQRSCAGGVVLVRRLGFGLEERFLSAQPSAPLTGRAQGHGGRRLVLWRHGRTTWNAEGRFQGQTDTDLDDVGRAQAARAASMLASLHPTAIVASDLRRAADTADALARLTGLEVRYDKGLRETFAGEWQGLSMAVIRERYAEQVEAWDRGVPGSRPEGGETRTEVAQRFVDAVERGLADLPDDGTLVVVSHGGAARVAICQLLGLPESSWFSIGVLSNCCWSVLAEGRMGWRLVEHNAGTLPQPVLSEEG